MAVFDCFCCRSWFGKKVPVWDNAKLTYWKVEDQVNEILRQKSLAFSVEDLTFGPEWFLRFIRTLQFLLGLPNEEPTQSTCSQILCMFEMVSLFAKCV